MNKTKVIVTIDKDHDSKNELLEFIKNGVNTFRVDLGKTTYQQCENIVNTIREINKDLYIKVSVLLDVKGPRINTGKFSGGEAEFYKGDKIRIYTENILGDKTKFSVDYKTIVDDVSYGAIIKVSNGIVELKVVDKGDDYLICQVIRGGVIENNSLVNIPDCRLKMDYINKKTKEDILFAGKIEADFIALSFISSVDDVLRVNDLLIESGNDHTAIISKIENESALDDLDEIIKISEGLMIARNDLGTEIPIERIPGIQKRIINKCHLAGKISIISMDYFEEANDYPSRAEVSDISTAILEGVDAILLGLTPIYKDNVVDLLQAINKIITTSELDIPYVEFYDKTVRSEEDDITGNIISSVAYISNKLHPCAIAIPSLSGNVAKRISRFHTNCPIIVLIDDESTAKLLNLNFGIYPVVVKSAKNLNEIIKISKTMAKKLISPNEGAKLLITGSYPFENNDDNNFIEIEKI